MIILNDTLTFTALDVASLSAELQTALTEYNGAATPEAELTNTVNAHLELVRTVAHSRDLDTVKSAIVSADAATRALAQAKLDEAKTILGIQFLPKEEPK